MLMKKNGLLAVVLLLLVTIVAACGEKNNVETNGVETTSVETKSPDPEKLRLAVTDVEGLEELQRDFEEFRKELETAIGVKIEFFAVSDRTAAVAAMQSDQVDMVMTGPAEYVILRSKLNVVPLVGIKQQNYRSQIVVWADSPIKTMADLKGKTIAMSDVGSTSGHLAPSKIIADAGLDPLKDVKVVMLGDSHLQALKNKDVDAWGGGWKHFERFLEKESLKKEQFRILQEGPLLPSDVFIASSKLSPEFVEKIRSGMLANEAALVKSILKGEANAKYEGTKLLPADDTQYEYVREMYKAIGVNDFTKFVE
jgi:phosphonate transport system substrate-binding protein